MWVIEDSVRQDPEEFEKDQMDKSGSERRSKEKTFKSRERKENFEIEAKLGQS